MTALKLWDLAEQARQQAYTPYSGFSVGAALLCADGRVFTGCNIENAAFSPTVCAERTAFFKAISEGERAFTAIAVSGGKQGEAGAVCPPCGVCRQVMLEFCDPESFRVILGENGTVQEYTLSEMLPHSFKLNKGNNPVS